MVAISRGEPDKIAAFRQGNAGGIVVGYGDGEMMVASDPAGAAAPYQDCGLPCRRRGRHGYTRWTPDTRRSQGEPSQKALRRCHTIPWRRFKGQYKHYMLKEIHEQPEAALNVMRGRVSFDTSSVDLDGFPAHDRRGDASQARGPHRHGYEHARGYGGPALDRGPGPPTGGLRQLVRVSVPRPPSSEKTRSSCR